VNLGHMEPTIQKSPAVHLSLFWTFTDLLPRLKKRSRCA
jgi:hypothetical protein